MPTLFGILNVTADSFSDGGKYLDPETAIAHAHDLMAQGADVIDVGAASSHPDAADVGAAEEIRRYEAVIPALVDAGIPVSIDSFEPEVHRRALGWGVQYLNDIQGFPDASVYPALAASDVKLIAMHGVQGRGRAKRLDVPAGEIWDRLFAFFDDRLAALDAAGIARDRLILDPGMGFFLGAAPEPSLEVLRHIARLEARYGLPVLVSVSRKSFLRRMTGRDVAEIGPATLAAEIYLAESGIACIRTHAPGPLRDALAVRAALMPQTSENKR